jgi:tetratricopeptide (TPR) repeat protein
MTGRLSKEIEFDFVGGNLVASGQVRAVILRHLTVGEIEAAARLLATSAPELGDQLLDEDMREARDALRAALAEMFVQARDFARAGRAALLIGDPARAAPFFERSYEFARAAELYEQAGKLDKAAELHERGLAFDKAAVLHEQTNALDRAADAWEKANRPYEAGRLWVKMRRLDRAVDVLQKVDPKHESWAAATSLLGRVLESAGHRDAAIGRYILVVKSGPISDDTIDVWERLGEIYVAANEEKAAQKLLSAVLAADPRRERARAAFAKLGLPKAVDAPAPQLALSKDGRVVPLVLPGAGAAPAAAQSAPLDLGPLEGRASMLAAPSALTSVNPDVDLLRNLPLFGELSLDEVRALADIGEKVEHPPGTVLIEQDREGQWLMVILGGQVLVSHVSESGERVLGELGWGASIGEMALIDEAPTNAHVRAKQSTTVFRWRLDRLRHFLTTNERTTLRILRVMTRTLSVRLRETNRLVAGR